MGFSLQKEPYRTDTHAVRKVKAWSLDFNIKMLTSKVSMLLGICSILWTWLPTTEGIWPFHESLSGIVREPFQSEMMSKCAPSQTPQGAINNFVANSGESFVCFGHYPSRPECPRGFRYYEVRIQRRGQPGALAYPILHDARTRWKQDVHRID